MVRVAGEGDLEAVLKADEPLHRVGRGWIHTDLAVPIHSHKAEGWVDGLVRDRKVQLVPVGNRSPIVDPGAAERIDSHVDPRAANSVHVDHIGKIGNVSIEIVMPVRRGRVKGLLERNSFHPAQAVLEKLVRFRSDPVGDDGLRGTAVRRIVLEPAIMGRIV